VNESCKSRARIDLEVASKSPNRRHGGGGGRPHPWPNTQTHIWLLS